MKANRGVRILVTNQPKLQLEYFVLRYVPNVLKDQSVNIGLAIFSLGKEDFGDVRFLNSWDSVLRVDPQADIEYLNAFARDMQGRFRDRQERDELVRLIKYSFSSTIQASASQFCTAEDGPTAVEVLSRQLFSMI